MDNSIEDWTPGVGNVGARSRILAQGGSKDAAVISQASLSHVVKHLLEFEPLLQELRDLDAECDDSAAVARKVSEAQAAERYRISNDIHNTVLQDLAMVLQMLARLGDRLEQALGALEDTALALEGPYPPTQSGKQAQIHASTHNKAWTGLYDCRSILGSLLGESEADLTNLKMPTPGSWYNRTSAMPTISTLRRLPDISGQCLVEDVLLLVRSTGQRLRDLCNDLRPAYQDVALVQTLSWSLQKLNQISANTTIDLLVLAEEPASLSRDVRCTCQQVAEQAVYNALLHAAASRIVAEITFPDALNSRAGITLCVTDDGIGFEPRSPLYWRSTQHHGLANMYESAALVGGTLNIESALGQGTRVSLWLPPVPHSI